MVGESADILDTTVGFGEGFEAALSKVEGDIQEVGFYQVCLCSYFQA